MIRLPENLTQSKQNKGGRRIVYVPNRERVTPGGPPASKREDVACYYLRAAHAYMLISMPTGTSTIFGAFQAILASPCKPDELPPWLLNYRLPKSSPAKSLALNFNVSYCCNARNPRKCPPAGLKPKRDQPLHVDLPSMRAGVKQGTRNK
jgi:hypothetical protein